jgi:hypothetical protein
LKIVAAQQQDTGAYNAKTIMHQVCGYSQGGPFFIHVYLYCRRYAQLNTPPDHYFVTEIFDTKNQLNPLVARTIYRVGRVNCFIVLRRISSGIRSIFFRYYIWVEFIYLLPFCTLLFFSFTVVLSSLNFIDKVFNEIDVTCPLDF